MSVARYDAVAEVYSGSVDDDSDPVVRDLLDLLGPVGGQRVLDLACGTGWIARTLHAHGAEVTGVDLSRSLLDVATSTGPAEIRYVHGDAADPGWLPSAPYDAVVCNFSLADIDDLGGTLATVHAALRIGGIFVFSILHPCFPGAAPLAGAWPMDTGYHDERWWRADGAESMLRGHVGANHRTLSTYLNTLIRHGLQPMEFREPRAASEWAAGKRVEATRYPQYLLARCRRI
jgi:SAM-dependent methyltransferase